MRMFVLEDGATRPKRRRAQKVQAAKAAKALATEHNRRVMRQISGILQYRYVDLSFSPYYSHYSVFSPLFESILKLLPTVVFTFLKLS